MTGPSVEESLARPNATESPGNSVSLSGKRSRIIAGFVYTGRAVTILVLISVTVWTCRNWSFLLDPAEATVPIAPLDLKTRANELGDMARIDGAWTFAGMPWQFSVRVISDGQIGSAIVQPVERKEFAAATRNGELALIQFMEDLEVPCTDNGTGRIFDFTCDEFRVAVRTSERRDGERVEVARLAIPETDQWTVFEVIPSESKDGPDELSGKHLLPLPALAQQICARQTKNGALLLEVVSVKATQRELFDDWRRRGWSIEEHETPGTRTLVCTFGSIQVLAWAEPHSDGLSTELVLFRNPAH